VPGHAPQMRRRWRRGMYPWSVIALPWGRYVRARHLFWRVRIPLWVAAAAAGWALAGPAGLAGGVALAYLAEGAFSYRKPASRGPVGAAAEDIAAARAEARRIQRRWQTRAVPSPAGWQPQAGSRPGWDWTPPDGLRVRLDRVPGWVRLWYKTPFADRYACSWMWYHGGWDVLPPTAQ
jgi:hypothetical protein